MENFVFCVPTKYVFGQGVSSQVGTLIRSYGFKKVLIVIGNHARKSGLLSLVEEQLKEQNIEYDVLSGVKPNPRADLVYEGIELGRKMNADFILPVGGGSVIDTA
ncbi:MAG: iron-containing alcohol dehydrogenase, partial [Succinivibrio sp.]